MAPKINTMHPLLQQSSLRVCNAEEGMMTPKGIFSGLQHGQLLCFNPDQTPFIEVREQTGNVQDPKTKEIKEIHQLHSSSFLAFTCHRIWGQEPPRSSSGGSAAGRGVPGPKRAAPVP